MQRAVADVHNRCEVERGRELCGHAEHVHRRRRAVFSDREVERLGGHVILREERRHAGDAGRQRQRQRGMRELGRDQPLERRDELMNFFRRQVEGEELDRNEPLALRVIRTEHRPQRPRTDLMKNTKRSERVWWRSAGRFRVQ